MKTFILSVFVFLVFAHSSNSQLSTYGFLSTNSTFTAVTSGTVLGSISNDEQVFNNSTNGAAAPQTDIGFPIGFNFNYNGTVFDRFAVNTNGWIILGTGSFAIGGTTTPISNISTAGFANIISAYGRDLQGQTGSELSYKLIGNAPNRTLVVQWLNYRRYNSTGDNLNFQIRLNELNNTINFVYGTHTTSNTSTSSAGNTTQLGLRGASNADYKNRTTTSSWSSSSAGSLNNSTMRHTTTVFPASGLSYTWTPVNMSYTSSTVIQADTTSVQKNSTNNVILKIQVVANGVSSPLSATGFTLNATGTTNVTDLTNAKVWYTGTSSIFAPATQFGTTVNGPSGSYTVTGSQQLVSGTNYFWLTYDVPLTAVTFNKIDAGCTSITVVSARIPTVTAPAGSRTISINPLSGSYNVGLSLFNLVTGKNLAYRKHTSKVQGDVFVQNENRNKKNASETETSSTGDCKKVSGEVEQYSYELMDGELPYTGAQYIPVTGEMRNRLGRGLIPDNINGIYASITTAISDLNVSGVQGPVTFYLVDAAYNSETFPIVINNVGGTSPENTITIKPAPGVTPQITMSSGTSMFKIYKTSDVIIDGSNSPNGTSRDLTLTSNYLFVSYCVWIASSGTTQESNITVKNCNLKTGEILFGSAPIYVSDGDASGSAGYFSGITIENNFLQKGRQAVYVTGGTVPQHISNVFVNDNVINSSGTDAVGYLGIYLQGVNTSVITGNEIANFNNTFDENDKGIWFANGSLNVTAGRNKIYNLGYTGTHGNGGHGIYVTPNTANASVNIVNNVIYNIYGDGWDYTDPINYIDNPAGIVIFSTAEQSGINIYNNSINLYGNTLTQNLALSSGIFISSLGTADIRNNVISNNLGIGTGTSYGSCGVFLQGSAAQLVNIDYNNYYVNPTGSGVKLLGKISNAGSSADISSWKSATGKDKCSLSYDPGFTSNSNLSPDVNSQNCWSLNGRGTQISVVSNDFNGTARSVTLSGGGTDIGAYEFVPAVQPPVITGTGIIADGSITRYLLAGDTVATVLWHGSSLPASLTVQYYSGVNPPGTPAGNYGNCYWAFTTAGGAGYSFDITLYWSPALIGTISGEINITMASKTTGVWTHYNALTNVVLRNVKQNGQSNLTAFTIDDGTSPLPVDIKYFNATASSRDVMLRWATENEMNNAGFEIQRKSESENKWTDLAFIGGGGTVSEERDYSFDDKKLNIGKYNYRIKQIDLNGNFEYFNLESSISIGKPLAFGISQNYPNPSNPKSKIDYQIPNDGLVNIRVYDIQGREVAIISNGFLSAGYYTSEFDGSKLASGVYFYRIDASGMTKTLKMILVK